MQNTQQENTVNNPTHSQSPVLLDEYDLIDLQAWTKPALHKTFRRIPSEFLDSKRPYLHVRCKHIEDLGRVVNRFENTCVLDSFGRQTVRVMTGIAVHVLRLSDDGPPGHHHDPSIQQTRERVWVMQHRRRVVESKHAKLRQHLVSLRLDVRLRERDDVDSGRDAVQRLGHALQPLTLSVIRDFVRPAEQVVLVAVGKIRFKLWNAFTKGVVASDTWRTSNGMVERGPWTALRITGATFSHAWEVTFSPLASAGCTAAQSRRTDTRVRAMTRVGSDAPLCALY
ncbi:unnamed protein product [Phytophthora fragariaefolia]|uniref:Unnamed protein product n=1 Tax=Phytophthora fragariaefolia TaxID=1490495 RepID=A0A9W6XV29_9STRA|nr:unnamed protein product [Phytophthora fragariaefolia]